MRKWMKRSWVLGCVVLAACTVKAVGDPEKPITINAHIVIDIREMKQTASSIEDMIAREAAAPAKPTQLSLLSVAEGLFEPELAYAEGGYDIRTMTPEVKAAFSGRASRFARLGALKATGKVGEDNEGHVVDMSGGEVADIVVAENADREVIYKAIVSQNGLAASAIHTVRSVFAEVQRSKAKPGEKIQLPSGSWTTKS